MSAGHIAFRLALLAVMTGLPALGLHQHVVALENRQQSLLHDAARSHNALVVQALAPALEQPMASALIIAPAAVAALARDRSPVMLLFRPHGAAAWYHVASSGSDPVEVGGGLMAALADDCTMTTPRQVDLAAADGRPLPATLAPTASRDGCWMVVTATDGAAHADPLGDTPGMRMALAAYAVMAALLGAMLCPATGGRRSGDSGEAAARVNLSAMARELAEGLTATHGQRLTIGTAVADGLWVRATAGRLKADLTTLLHTAVEATPAGGFVGLRLEGGDRVCVLTVEHEKPMDDLAELRRHISDLGGRVRIGAADHGQRILVELPRVSVGVP